MSARRLIVPLLAAVAVALLACNLNPASLLAPEAAETATQSRVVIPMVRSDGTDGATPTVMLAVEAVASPTSLPVATPTMPPSPTPVPTETAVPTATLTATAEPTPTETSTPQPGAAVTIIITRPADAPTPTVPSEAGLRQAAEASFNAVNDERVAQGLAPLAWDEGVYTVSKQVADYLARNHLFSHRLPDDPETMVASLFDPEANRCGENLALKYSLEEISRMNWEESPPHYEIAMMEELTKGAAAVSPIEGYVRAFRQGDPTYGDQDETLEFGGTEYILVFRACR